MASVCRQGWRGVWIISSNCWTTSMSGTFAHPLATKPPAGVPAPLDVALKVLIVPAPDVFNGLEFSSCCLTHAFALLQGFRVVGRVLERGKKFTKGGRPAFGTAQSSVKQVGKVASASPWSMWW